MRGFAVLFSALDRTTRTNLRVAALAEYFRTAPEPDRVWTIALLSGRRPRRAVTASQLRSWAAEAAGLPDWLFAECYGVAGDLAETIALVLPPPGRPGHDRGLAGWIAFLRGLRDQDEAGRRAAILEAWDRLAPDERLVFNKLITGGFRMGVSQKLMTRALAQATGQPEAQLAHRLMGDWTPERTSWHRLVLSDDPTADLSRPYPFCLAHPLDGPPETLGSPQDWLAEWKWDGIRAQLVRRGGAHFVWSRGEELVTDRFPELAALRGCLPEGCVIDGELLGWRDGRPLPFADLQTRLGRKTVSRSVIERAPVVLVAYDLLELGGNDLRAAPLSHRRQLLGGLLDGAPCEAPLRLSPALTADNQIPGFGAGPSAGFAEGPAAPSAAASASPSPSPCASPSAAASGAASGASGLPGLPNRPRPGARGEMPAGWDALVRARAQARVLGAEGLMLKRRASRYGVGRRRGDWWKWKLEPFTVDAVMVYAQAGHGRRATLYTDFTFAVWDGAALAPVTKAYSGLTDAEFAEITRWVRRNTLERYGPVRRVTPELVFEIAFEGIQPSRRHKSGLALRFPRMLRWRRDKPAAEADRIETLRAMIAAQA